MAVEGSLSELSGACVGSLVVGRAEARLINHRLEVSLGVREDYHYRWRWVWVRVWVWVGTTLGSLEWPLIRGQSTGVSDGNSFSLSPSNDREVFAHVWDLCPWELKLQGVVL